MAVLKLFIHVLCGQKTRIVSHLVFLLVIRSVWISGVAPAELDGTHSGVGPSVTSDAHAKQEPHVRPSEECDCGPLSNTAPDTDISQETPCHAPCTPQINVTVSTDVVSVLMSGKSPALVHKLGGHIIYRAHYWKSSSPDQKQQPEDSTNPLILRDLEPGQEYCFQVVFLNFHRRYGLPSRKICKVIPESSAQRRVRVIVCGMGVVLLLAFVVGVLYFTYVQRKWIKSLLQLPVDIPSHYEEFLSGEFSRQTLALSNSEELDSLDLITPELEEDRRGEENTSDRVEG